MILKELEKIEEEGWYTVKSFSSVLSSPTVCLLVKKTKTGLVLNFREKKNGVVGCWIWIQDIESITPLPKILKLIYELE